MESTVSGNSMPPKPPVPPGQNTGSTTSDILIFIVIAYMLLDALLMYLLNTFYPRWYDSKVRYAYFALNVIWAAGPVILGIAVRNKILKIIGIIMGGLYAIYIIASNIAQLIAFLKFH
jgi:hypothetical protein